MSRPRDSRGRFVKVTQPEEKIVMEDGGVRDFNRVAEHGELNEEKQHQQDIIAEFIQSAVGAIVGIFIVLLILLAFCGCAPQEKTVYVPKAHIVTVHTFAHDTIIETKLVPYYTERETRDTASHLSNEYAYSDASISDGVLKHSLGIHPDAKTEAEAKIKEVVIERIDSIPYPAPYPVEVERDFTFFEQLLMRVGGLALIVLALWGAWRILKRKFLV